MPSVDLLYFGPYRELFGRDGERVETPSHVVAVADLIGWLAEQGEPWCSAFAEPAKVLAAVEGEAATPEDSVFGAREVALFPPGGAL